MQKIIIISCLTVIKIATEFAVGISHLALHHEKHAGTCMTQLDVSALYYSAKGKSDEISMPKIISHNLISWDKYTESGTNHSKVNSTNLISWC